MLGNLRLCLFASLRLDGMRHRFFKKCLSLDLSYNPKPAVEGALPVGGARPLTLSRVQK